LHEPPKK